MNDYKDFILEFVYENIRKKKNDYSKHKTFNAGLLEWASCFLKKHFPLPFSEMHQWLADILNRTSNHRGIRINLLAPRGSAKSTLGTLAYPMYQMLENREPYIWIISDTRSQAQMHLGNIVNEIKENQKIIKNYKNVFNRNFYFSSNRLKLGNGCVIECYGTGQRIRGRRHNQYRPTLIVCDDIQNDDHIISATRRNRTRLWFQGTLLKAGTPQTNFLQLATALHPEAIAMELASTPGWHTKIFPSIISFPERGDLWDEWKKIYLNIESKDSDRDARLFFGANKQEMLRGAKVLWEEKESLYDLMKMRVDGGERAFDREKQNIPQNPDFCEFPENYFSDSIWCDILPESFRYSAIAMDPSKGKNTNFGDYTALVFAGMDESGIIYIDANIARRPVHEIPEVSFNFYMCHKPDIFGVEVNQFQELLKDMLNQYFADNGISQVSVYPVTNHINKTIRIRRLGSLFSTERIRFYRKSSSNKLLVEQLKTFPTGEHDDGPDAMEMAVRLITMLQKSSDQRDVFSSGSFL